MCRSPLASAVPRGSGRGHRSGRSALFVVCLTVLTLGPADGEEIEPDSGPCYANRYTLSAEGTLTARDPSTGRLRFVEVKGRIEGAETITVTRNEILTCLNKPDRFWLAIVKVSDGVPSEPVYLKAPFTKEPDFGVTSVNYGIHGLLERAETPQ